MKTATIVITAIASIIMLVVALISIDNYGLGSIVKHDTAQNLLLLAIAVRAITAWGGE